MSFQSIISKISLFIFCISRFLIKSPSSFDAIDISWFGGSHAMTAIGGIVLGLVLLYLPDGDLKEIQKL